MPNKTRLLLYLAVKGKVKKEQPSLHAFLANEVGYSVSQVYTDIEDLQKDKLIAEKKEDDGSHSYLVTRKGYDSIQHFFRSPILYGGEVALMSILLVWFGVGSLYGQISGLPLAVGIVAVAVFNALFGIKMMWTPIRLSKIRRSVS